MADICGTRARAARFRRDESGGILVFGLIVLVMMLVVAGVAVDVMRYESQRTRLQGTIDRAILAATSLSQQAEAEDVVDSYFEAAGLSGYLGPVVVDEGFNFRTVTAQAASVMPTMFMRLVGIDTLEPRARGSAEERITDVEVSLVLDVSGSMGSYNRISNMRAAAQDFVDILIGDNTQSPISISLIPYNAEVNGGEALLSRFSNVAHDQPYSHCLDFQAEHFTRLAISPDEPLIGSGHGSLDNYTTSYAYRWLCPVPPGHEEAREVFAYGGTAGPLRSRIGSLTAQGNTSIDIGMRWGTLLLDPAMRPVISDMIDEGLIPDQFEGRPFDYGQPNTMKVIVLMTDGENVSYTMLRPEYRSGPSGVWIYDGEYASDDAFSVFDPDRGANGRYWWSDDGAWHDYPYGMSEQQTCTTERICTRWRNNGTCRRWQNQQVCTSELVGNARELEWSELFQRASIRWVARELFAASEGYSSGWSRTNRGNDIYSSMVQGNGSNAVKDARLLSLCQLARDQGVIVFTVAFEAPTRGVEVLRDCASSPAHFFDVDGLDIGTAFRAIARQIMQLRLTE